MPKRRHRIRTLKTTAASALFIMLKTTCLKKHFLKSTEKYVAFNDSELQSCIKFRVNSNSRLWIQAENYKISFLVVDFVSKVKGHTTSPSTPEEQPSSSCRMSLPVPGVRLWPPVWGGPCRFLSLCFLASVSGWFLWLRGGWRQLLLYRPTPSTSSSPSPSFPPFWTLYFIRERGPR